MVRRLLSYIVGEIIKLPPPASVKRLLLAIQLFLLENKEKLPGYILEVIHNREL
jgi:hypothetical protein